MSSALPVLAATVVLIGASAFFVAVEFALIAARKHRLDELARFSVAARAASRSAAELSVLLAGSQLGITVCTLLLGAVTKPAVHHWITPAVHGIGAPLWVADLAGFGLALAVVTFLHLVVGEMAPKSWAIAHPERSAVLLALPMRGFMFLTRPLLLGLNRLANLCLHRFGIEAVDEIASAQDPSSLRQLVSHSGEVGALDADQERGLSWALDLEQRTVGDLMAGGPLSLIDPDAPADAVRAAARRSGHLRQLVGTGALVQGVVHVRDALAAGDDVRVRELARPVPSLPVDAPVAEALRLIRDERSHLIVVTRDGAPAGVLTPSDLMLDLLARRGE